MREFDWDIDKDIENERKHGVDFSTALRVFADRGRIEQFDAKHSRNEERWATIGCDGTRILYVVYTERGRNLTRIISARKATKNEQKTYYQSQG